MYDPNLYWYLHLRVFRYEITEDNETWIIKNVHACSDNFSKHYFLNYKNSAVNYEKNLDAISAICSSVNSQLYVLSADHDLPTDHAARDVCHSGPAAMTILAEKFADLQHHKTTHTPWG